MRRTRHRNRNKRIQNVLVAHFPACFKPRNFPKLPLKVGIAADILVFFPELPPRHLERALYAYTNEPSYQTQIVVGAFRYDLEGNKVDPITPEQEAHAAKRLLAMDPHRVEKFNRRAAKLQGTLDYPFTVKL